MNEKNDDMIKKALESEPVPEELSPENIKKLLDERARLKKRKNIKKTVLRVSAGAAACAVICGVGVHYAGQRNSYNKNGGIMEIAEVSSAETQKIIGNNSNESFMSSASDYGELYQMFEKAAEKYNDSYNIETLYNGMKSDEMAMKEVADGSEMSAAVTGGEDISRQEYSETYNQEEGVLEADIAKTDGKYIYYLYSEYSESVSITKQYINVAEADNGSFADSNLIDISGDFPSENKENCDTNVILHDMYLYNDMLIVIGSVQIFDYSDNIDEYGAVCGIAACDASTFVNVYTTGINPQLVDSYYQDGGYEDVRISPEGYMYLITNDYSEEFSRVESEEDVEAYIPSYLTEGGECLIAPENIMFPDDGLDECLSIDYLIIGSLDLNTSGDITETDIKALAGYSSNIYCSGDNLYTAAGWEDTDITRFSLSRGIITPEASGTVKGYVNDQFSMSEYNGYFRIATTYEDWTGSFFDEIFSYERDSINNYVYVLDMDLNIVGSVSDFGIDETIKSVNFNGNMAYVVTYEQTDPLFGIDLSDPEQPVILDEFKINGYSTYMQQWSEGLLLGFGVSANENGIENGVKLVMFDNSDPNELNEVGIYVIDGDNDYTEIYSNAVWERKALLVAPEKNIIGVPITTYGYHGEGWTDWYEERSYMFFSYEEGQFVLRGEISENTDIYYESRAVYIGDYVYVLSGAQFIAADINTVSQTDIVEF